MEVSTVLYICRYCVFTWGSRVLRAYLKSVKGYGEWSQCSPCFVQYKWLRCRWHSWTRMCKGGFEYKYWCFMKDKKQEQPMILLNCLILQRWLWMVWFEYKHTDLWQTKKQQQPVILLNCLILQRWLWTQALILNEIQKKKDNQWHY